MKAIILARVSTEEQKEAGNSLPAQIGRLERYCERKAFEVLKKYSFDESAYKTKRDDFDKILEDISKLPEKVAICFDKVDRLSRNIFDKRVSELYEKAIADEIELHFVSDGQVIDAKISAVEKFQFGMNLGLAKYYSDAISDNIKRAWEKKIENGEIMTKAPIGYYNRRVDEKQDVYIDAQRAPLIVKVFEMYATGLYSMQKIAEEMEKLGLKSKHNDKVLKCRQIESILKNPFYCGFIVYQRTGQVYAHKYESLISKELFEKCKAVREAKTKNPTKACKHEFILSGMVLCADCGCRVTPELKKGKYKYYHCTDSKKICKKEFIREEKLIEPINKVFGNVALTDIEIEQILEGYDKYNLNQNKYIEGQLKAYRAQYGSISGKIEIMYDDKLEGRITTDMYDKKVKELNIRKQELERKIQKLQTGNDYCRITAKHLLSITKRLQNIFESSEVDEKRQILNLVFQNFSLQSKKLLFNTKTPFKEVFECNILSNNASWSG
jgi:site-specific DNA recombinase